MRIITLIIASFAVLHTAFSQPASGQLRPNLGEKIGVCRPCGMDVFERMLTKVEIVMADSVFHTCGLGCAAAMTEGKSPSSTRVVDFSTLTMVNMESAWYVAGSIIAPVRAMMPVFAFANKKDAEAFAAAYGGHATEYGTMKLLVEKIRQERKK